MLDLISRHCKTQWGFVLPCKAAAESEGPFIWLILKYYLECNLIFKYYSECNQKSLTLGTQSRCVFTFLPAALDGSFWLPKKWEERVAASKVPSNSSPQKGDGTTGTARHNKENWFLLFLVSCAFLLYLDLFWLSRLFISRHQAVLFPVLSRAT